MLKEIHPVRNLLDAGWKRFSAFFVGVLVDTAMGTVLFLGLLWFDWLFGLGKAVGIKQDFVDAFISVHFWADYGVFAAIGLSFFLRVLRAVFREGAT
jgi:hypothetical protein